MPTPAISITETHHTNVSNWWRQPPFVDNWQRLSDTVGVAYGEERQYRPASHGNPIREDRTRTVGPWSHTVWRSSSPIGTIVTGSDFNSAEYMSQGVLISPLGYEHRPGFNSDLIDGAVFKAVQQIKEGKVNLGVALAEARQTAALLGSTASNIARDIEKLMSGKRGLAQTFGRMSSWKKIPERYLEASYGWSPLLSDVLTSCQNVADAQTRGMTFNLTVHGMVTATDDFIVDRSNGLVNSSMRGSTKRAARCTLCYYLPGYLMPLLSSLGLTNPFEVAWEKVPYSFVLDWLVPIGPWLSTLDADTYLQFREGCITEYVSASGTERVSKGRIPGTPVLQLSTVSPGSFRFMQMDRRVLIEPPTVNFPRLKNPLSLDKAAKGMALLTQVFKRWA